MDTRIGMGEAGGSGATSAPDNAPSSATGRQRPVLTSRMSSAEGPLQGLGRRLPGTPETLLRGFGEQMGWESRRALRLAAGKQHDPRGLVPVLHRVAAYGTRSLHIT